PATRPRWGRATSTACREPSVGTRRPSRFPVRPKRPSSKRRRRQRRAPSRERDAAADSAPLPRARAVGSDGGGEAIMADGTRLSGRKVAMFLAEGFEDLEFWVTLMRLREEAADVTVVGIAGGETVRGKHALEA